MSHTVIRKAIREDIPEILSFIRELAFYEKLEEQVVATPELLDHWLFQEHAAEVLFAVEDGKAVGFALYFYTFSTFLGRAGIHLEDLFVREEYRGRGHGTALLKELACIAVNQGCGRLEWSCLRWNEPSLRYYRSLGGVTLDEWQDFRMDGDTLRNFSTKDKHADDRSDI